MTSAARTGRWQAPFIACDNRSQCPLGYKPYEHRKIESSLILSCGVHRAYSQVDIGYDYYNEVKVKVNEVMVTTRL